MNSSGKHTVFTDYLQNKVYNQILDLNPFNKYKGLDCMKPCLQSSLHCNVIWFKVLKFFNVFCDRMTSEPVFLVK